MKTAPDSTKSRDHQRDQQILPVTPAPDIDVFLTVRPQITFFQQNYFDEICSIVTYAANSTHVVPTLPNLPITVGTLHILEASILSDSTDISVITVQENNQSQEEDNNSSPSSLTALSDDSISTDNSPAPIQPVEPTPIQPVEPVIGLTTEEQR